MSRPAPAHCQDALRWLKERGWSLAPLTGQDRASIEAISHCWQLWTRSDEAGRRAAIDAVAALLDGCQEICWPMARELVAQAGDWSHRDEVWPKVVERFEDRLLLRGIRPLEVADRSKRLEFSHKGLTQVQS